MNETFKQYIPGIMNITGAMVGAALGAALIIGHSKLTTKLLINKAEKAAAKKELK